jgi:flavorubredoxin
MTSIVEIAPDVYRLCTYNPDSGLQFCQFLFKDDEPLLFHTGHRRLFEGVREAVARVIDPASVRWIGHSHFEADECGSLNEWLELAPQAQSFCSVVGARTSVSDFAIRPPRPMQHGERFSTGQFQFRFCQTPHVPHCWDAGLLFEETQAMLLCSDLLLQRGDVAPTTESDVLGSVAATLEAQHASPTGDSMPYTSATDSILDELAQLEPRLLATHHGSTYSGDGAQVLRDLVHVLRDVHHTHFGRETR